MGQHNRITIEILQSREVLFQYKFYFTKSKYLKLTLIEIEDYTTGEVQKVKSEDELKSILDLYMSFIEFYKILG